MQFPSGNSSDDDYPQLTRKRKNISLIISDGSSDEKETLEDKNLCDFNEIDVLTDSLEEELVYVEDSFSESSDCESVHSVKKVREFILPLTDDDFNIYENISSKKKFNNTVMKFIFYFRRRYLRGFGS